MRKKDWLWLLLYPLYQVLGTLRHEASHALFAVLQGGHIEKFVILPSWDTDLGLIWGGVNLSGRVNWLTLAAPYVVDLLTFSLGFLLCAGRIVRRRWLWLNLYILLMLSPMINTLYNYRFSLLHDSDVSRLLRLLPSPAVHTFFLLALLYYFTAGIYVWIYAPDE